GTRYRRGGVFWDVMSERGKGEGAEMAALQCHQMTSDDPRFRILYLSKLHDVEF
ncbi:hypothetical protein CHS0354_031395, partial [Potamilus streckersoni]